MFQCCVELDEGPVGRKGDPGCRDLRALEQLVVLEELEVVDQPEDGGVPEVGLRLLDHDVAGTPEGELDVAHGCERDPDQHPEDVALGADVGLDRDGRGNLVRGGSPGRR